MPTKFSAGLRVEQGCDSGSHSVYPSRFFLGSLLLLDCDSKSPPFSPISLRGAKPKTVELRPTQLVLDGQQRLTSLLYSMHAPDLELKGSRRPRSFL